MAWFLPRKLRGGRERLVAQFQGPWGWASWPVWMTHTDSRSSQRTSGPLRTPRPIPSCLPSLPVTRPKRPIHMACGERQLSSPMSSSPDPSSPQGNGAAASTASFYASASVTQTLWGTNSREWASGENIWARPGIGKSWKADSEEEMKTPVTSISTSSPAAGSLPPQAVRLLLC